MINEESQKKILNYMEIVQQEKIKQNQTIASLKKYTEVLNNGSNTVKKNIDNFFDERSNKIAELNVKLQLAIQHNDKEAIFKITAELGGIDK
ncbi:hypothetical protein L2D08_07585 [Domibacillus sp. PGB-M46]|uniref:hypothetical protein n=1 Tax=Domibacillus sp. PGB-M46 TaxID=2910255 RepID=UPI001F58F43B|nr:hypothetical protein [Domibacillus sp. PGB-M46]MCI2254222.1 hypothetical protein [Domibacillus sp. PGB-M46]